MAEHPGLPSFPPPGGGRRSGGPDETPRRAQLESLLRRVLQERLARGLSDPRVQGMISILGIDLTSDLSSATVRVSVYPADRGPLTLSGLRSATGLLQVEVRKATKLRRVPELRFQLDDSLKREAALEATLRAVRAAEGEEDGEEAAAEVEVEEDRFQSEGNPQPNEHPPP